jgi:hypothetical protein
LTTQNFFLLKEDGDYLLQEDGVSRIIISQITTTEGGPAGGRVKKKVGQRLIGDKPSIKSIGQALGKIRFTNNNFMHSAISIPTKARTESLIQLSKIESFSEAQITLHTYNESKSYIRVPQIDDGIIREDQRSFFEPTGYELKQYYEKLDKVKKLVEIVKLYHQIEAVEKLQTNSESFSFEESYKDWQEVVRTEQRFRAFTNTSSFVGNVRYDRDNQEMTMILNGKEYNFCNVPERKFDTLMGATSVGKAFNDVIKGQHDC